MNSKKRKNNMREVEYCELCGQNICGDTTKITLENTLSSTDIIVCEQCCDRITDCFADIMSEAGDTSI